MTIKNDATWTVVTADTATEYEITEVHHRSGSENGSQHNAFVYVDPPDATLLIGWTWQGRRDDEPAPPVKLEKGVPGSAGDIPIFPGQRITCWLERNGVRVSDSVANLNGEFSSAPWETGNSMHHQSYNVRFGRRNVVEQPTTTDDATKLAQVAALLRQALQVIGE